MRRRFLFVHQNFPGQFTHLAPELARRGHEVLALTASTNQRPMPVRTVRYQFTERPFPHDDWRIAAHFAGQARRGEQVARAALQLKREGFTPDVIIGHPGWGETLFLADVWPAARLIAYAEFFYRATGQDVGFDPEFESPAQRMAMRVRARQASQLLALETAREAISPTAWQASTYPAEIRRRIAVIHDGIDTEQLRPDPAARLTLLDGRLTLRHGEEVLSFVSRNLEPYRGFHIFMRALPGLLRQRPQARVIIVGGDGQSYGGPPPGPGSWRDHMLREVGDRLDMSRVHFVGKLPYPAFLALMQVTRVHAYLTYPFVLSWSFLEAMSMGALTVASRTAPLAEVIRDGENGLLTDFFDVAAWTEMLARTLAAPDAQRDIRHAARQTITARYDLRGLCLPRQIALCEA